MQCEASRWRLSLEAYLEEKDVRESLDKKRAEEIRQERQRSKKGKAYETPAMEADPFLDHNVERKLWIGLNCALTLAESIHKEVINSAPLATEPGCEDVQDITFKTDNASFLLSVLRQLPNCPGRNSKVHEWWMGKGAVRLPLAQQRAAPPEGSAQKAGEANLMHPREAGHGDGAAPKVRVGAWCTSSCPRG